MSGFSKEGSGTNNMKLELNVTLTISKLNGTNIKSSNKCGRRKFFYFSHPRV
ncbi:MAG: glycogen/starch/alpha-glucan phosphorylase [Sodalis sp. (in: enterobacteria)]